EHLVNQRVERTLLAHHPADDVAEERRFRRQILIALHLAPDPMALELRQDVVHAGAGDVHLVERLHRGKPRRPASVGLAFIPRGGGHDQPVARRRLRRTSASAARAASPPLFASSTLARIQACASLSTVRMPLPIGTPRVREISIRPREDSNDTISKWMVSPRMTQPSATAPSYGLSASSAASSAIVMAGGISSEPGTAM